MKILQGLKGSYYKQKFLALGFNYFYCLNETCENPDEENKDSALIIFSFLNKSNIEIDLIDYIFTNNKKYIIIDLAENVKIENNIFGLDIYLISRGGWEYNYDLDEMGIEITFLDNGNGIYIDDEEEEVYLPYGFYPNNSKINISFSKNSYEEKYIDIDHYFVLKLPSDRNKFIEYTDEINSNFGYPEIIYLPPSIYSSNKFHYYIKINMSLNIECNDTNCNLCLFDDTDYCFLCKVEYKIISDSKYGKRKICLNDIITETTYVESIITTEITTIPLTTTITTVLTTIPETAFFENIMTTEITTFPLTTTITTDLTTIPETTFF